MSEDIKIIVTNRKARHEYHIEDPVEAGIALQGTEVKSLRTGKVNLQDAYCTVQQGEMKLVNCHIAAYEQGSYFNHDPLRVRTLLLHRREIQKFAKATEQKGYTIVPLKMYFKNGRAKVEIGLARGKKHYDKRADIAERDTKRQLDRLIRRSQYE